MRAFDFSIRSDSIPTVSFADVLRGDAAVIAGLKGKKAIVGGTAIELGDRITAPNGQVISGALLHAIAAESIPGGFGVVYKAFQADLERVVALKFLHTDSPESTERFMREARATGSLAGRFPGWAEVPAVLVAQCRKGILIPG